MTAIPTPTTAPASASTVHLTVVSGGMGEPSLTGRLADRLGDAARVHLERHGLTVHTAEVRLRTLAVAVAQAHVGTVRDPRLEQALEDVLQADALVAVTPTYKASVAGISRAFWELVGDGALTGMPTLLGATGGTARHSLVIDTGLRPLFAQLGAHALPRGVFAATDDWGGGPASSDGTEALARRIDAAGRSLAESVLRSVEARVPASEPTESAVPGPAGPASGAPAPPAAPADAPSGEAPSPSETPFAAILGRH
ncbi:CE1759 family FMN reductase [Micrococcus luteus]